MALAASDNAAPDALSGPGQTGVRVAVRGEAKAKAARPAPLSALNGAEWMAAVGVDAASTAVKQEARALRASVDEDAASMARGQALLRDRWRADADALRLSQRAGHGSGEADGAEDE